MESNKNLHERGIAAAERYLARRGYEILDTAWACEHGVADIVADDDGTLAFVKVITRNVGEGLPATEVTAEDRVAAEMIAIGYLAGCDRVDMPVRFDVLSIAVLEGGERALIRHHISAINAA